MKKYATVALVLMVFLGISSALAQGDGTGAFQQMPKDGSGDHQEVRSTAPALTADQITCIKTAISKREDALTAGETAYASAVNAAYLARKTALLAAWDSADAKTRRVAVRAADQAFRTSVQTARKAWNSTRRSAWSTFESDRKVCSPKINSSDTGSSQTEASI